MDTHEQACWLATLTGEVWPLPRAKEILREWTVDKHRSVAALLALSAEQAMQELGLRETEAVQLAELAGMAVSLQKELGKLARLDVRLISRTDAAYPEGLEQRLPEAFLPYYLFFCHGSDRNSPEGLHHYPREHNQLPRYLCQYSLYVRDIF